MIDIKTKVQNLDPNVSSRNMQALVDPTGNIYESLVVMTKRARQLSSDIKLELGQKLQEFSVNVEAAEEVQENKEQVEISKFYERLPNPSIIAMDEFLKGDIHFQYPVVPEVTKY